MDKKIITGSSLQKFIEVLIGSYPVFAPVKKGNHTEFQKVNSFAEITSDYIVTRQSPKFIVFPRNETFMTFSVGKESVETAIQQTTSEEMVIFGGRPCDGIGLNALGAIFKWDFQDQMYTQRAVRTLTIGLACSRCDDDCFCTSVGSGPGDISGMDILLTRISDDEYLAEIVTDKGTDTLNKYPGYFAEAGDINKEIHLAKVKPRKDFRKLKGILPAKFENRELWMKQSLRCIGCGVCAYVCPACACFDIQDETHGRNGRRVKCWDSCGFRMFTLHTSGHNPREVQSERWRQRILHKFSYMPERQEVFGCTGCGRCSRACPADMNMAEHLEELCV